MLGSTVEPREDASRALEAERLAFGGVRVLPLLGAVCAVSSAENRTRRLPLEASEVAKRGVPRPGALGVLGDRPAVVDALAVCGRTASMSEKGEGKRSDSVGRAALGNSAACGMFIELGVAISGTISLISLHVTFHEEHFTQNQDGHDYVLFGATAGIRRAGPQ
jgi:hypothetical protein